MLVAAGAAVTLAAARGPNPDVVVTADEVRIVNEDIVAAYDALVDMWDGAFAAAGREFRAPEIARYRTAVRTACGVMPANNAVYCPRANAIYFDDVFATMQAKRAARELGTDGDMAAIGIIAHEMGHAAAIQLGLHSRFAYPNEMIADCFAGAFARRSDRDGHLEKGDIEEAFFGMAAAGDPTPELTGDRRLDDRILMRAALMGHGTRTQRMENFRAGLGGGTDACVERFRAFFR
jgi:predicted metalloprotease